MMKVIIFILLLISVIHGQVSLSVEINTGGKKETPVVISPPDGYITVCEPREDIVVIGPDMIGFWVRSSSGRFVLHCRNTWYDDRSGIVYYGPWREDRRAIYNGRYKRYDDVYLCSRYPHYKGHKKEEHYRGHSDNGEHRGHHKH